MKKKRWVKIKTEHPNVYYLLSSKGDWIKRSIYYRDARGVVRGKNAKHRKVKKCIDTFYPSKNLNERNNKIEVKFDAGVHKTQSKKLANMVLYYFGDKEPPCYNASINYKDGDPTNCSIDNLEWLPQKRDGIEYNMKAYRYYKEHTFKGNIRYFRVPESHPLYSQYMTYMENFNKTSNLVNEFVDRHNIQCRQIRVGKRLVQYMHKGKQRLVKRHYFELMDDDINRIKHDIESLQPSMCNRKNKKGYYHLRFNGDLMKEWIALLEYNNHIIAEIPQVRSFTNLNDNDKLIRSFAFYKNDLYVRIETKKEFKVDSELIEVKGITFE